MSTADRPSVTDDASAEARNVSHIGRSFHGTRLEDDCPCPKGPCGLAIHDGTDHGCDQHDLGAARTIRQMHSAADCPAAGRAETTAATDEDAPPGEVLIDDTDWVPWRDLPRYAAKQKQAAEDAQREAKRHYLAREGLEGLLARPTPSRDQIANALAVTDVHHPDHCDCGQPACGGTCDAEGEDCYCETEMCNGLEQQIENVAALLADQPTTTEWAHRLDNGGASIHRSREDAEQAQRDYEHQQADRYPVDDPPGPESAGIWRREVTEWIEDNR